MVDAAPALLKVAQPAARHRASLPAGMKLLADIPNPVHAAWVGGWLELLINIQPLVGRALLMADVPHDQVDRCSKHVMVSLACFMEASAHKAGIQVIADHDGLAWVPIDDMVQPDWDDLIAETAELKAAEAAGGSEGTRTRDAAVDFDDDDDRAADRLAG
ncbi:MAG TPA: hypothetical protein VHL31_19550 [Geminicoccus sp.]|uniref:hypothetical protein n=1 Tax=Geminicoccus sp. TaxID=2024832 RepID=UPI002E33B2F0|nr:hypothetical protein [Geminicoccus sp.]HEX2528482.1 hypothetical protein [Geminicoccus sp.]